MKEWKPTADRVLVKKIPDKRKVGSLFVPDVAGNLPTVGVVIAVGPGRFGKLGERIEPPAKAGDIVLFSPHGGMPIPELGEGVAVYFSEEILATRRPEPSELKELIAAVEEVDEPIETVERTGPREVEMPKDEDDGCVSE